MTGIAIDPRPELIPPTTSTPRAWLVTFDTTRDNIPVRAFLTREEADEYVHSNPPYHPDDKTYGKRATPDIRKAHDLVNYGLAHVHGYTIWQFAEGVPLAAERFYWPDSESDPNPWPTTPEDQYPGY